MEVTEMEREQFLHLGIPHIAVVTSTEVKQGRELLLDEYGESYVSL